MFIYIYMVCHDGEISDTQWMVIMALMMDAVLTSEMLVSFNMTTRHYIPRTLNFILVSVRT
jgi:hypothetical protein